MMHSVLLSRKTMPPRDCDFDAPGWRVRVELKITLEYEVVSPRGADFIFHVHAAHTPRQTVTAESLQLSQAILAQLHTDPMTGNRVLCLHALPGPLSLVYAATVDLVHHSADPSTLREVPVSELPAEVLGYLYPSRYCQSDRLVARAAKEFGHLPPGYGRVLAIRDWVRQHVSFQSGSSNGGTSALDTLVGQAGVCRDFAHLMIALCRSLNIPARFVTGTDYGADPALGPPDFHAYVEAYVGHGWYIFDPSGTGIPMGFARLSTGRDATDVAFATIFGAFTSKAPVVHTRAIEDMRHHIVLPRHQSQALSSDPGYPRRGHVLSGLMQDSGGLSLKHRKLPSVESVW